MTLKYTKPNIQTLIDIGKFILYIVIVKIIEKMKNCRMVSSSIPSSNTHFCLASLHYGKLCLFFINSKSNSKLSTFLIHFLPQNPRLPQLPGKTVVHQTEANY